MNRRLTDKLELIRAPFAISLRSLLWAALIAATLWLLAGAFPRIARTVKHAYAASVVDTRYCPPGACVLIRMRDGSTCRVWTQPYGSNLPERWEC